MFILSLAGKPIYSRYGNEDKLASIMGVMQALVSFVEDDKDELEYDPWNGLGPPQHCGPHPSFYLPVSEPPLPPSDPAQSGV